MEDFVDENDNQSFHRHDAVRNENENKSSQLSGLLTIEDRYNEFANTANFQHGDGIEQELPLLSNTNENTATMINNVPTTNTGGSSHDAHNIQNYNTTNSIHNDEEEFTTVSMSPDERNTFFPSSSSSRRASLQEYSYNNHPTSGSDDHAYQTTTRPSRESVLQRLCEALLRRSLTKIDLSQRGLIPSDARLVKMALLQNQQLTILKLGYNNLGDYGAAMLADGINSNVLNLLSLDLGFNNIGDVGCTALCRAISPRLHTLYLAGNLIGEDGAVAIADLIRKRGSRLRKLYLTGNLIGPDGVKAITEAIIETETRQCEEETYSITTQSITPTDESCNNGSIEELYLGGSGMGTVGCQYVARLLEISQKLRVISLPNCEIDDESIAQIATSIKANRERLPLQSLQLSFNCITCKGVECLANSVWGSQTMQELLLDNNEIADRGAQHIAAVLLPHVKTLEVLNIGFNLIKAPGIQILMKAVVDTNCTLRSLSISGNSIDTSAAKAISYALAYNRTLQSLSLVHCNIGHEGQRHISAGVVSNSRSALREVSGYDLGPVIVTLGFPAALESWSNDKILFFLHKMWNHHRGNHLSSMERAANEVDPFSPEEEEKLTDPLNFLGGSLTVRTAPEDATIVVEVANKAYAELCEHELESCARKRRGSDRRNRDSPLTHENEIPVPSLQPPIHSNRGASMLPANKMASFVASPEPRKLALPNPARKTRIAEWLSANIKELTKLSHLPFSSAELWRLHQHYFSPVVNESGGESIAPSSDPSVATAELTSSSVPAVSRPSSTENPCATILENSDGDVSSMSQPATSTTGNQMASLPILKRKVSYRFLGEAATFTSQCGVDNRNVNSVLSTPQTVSLMIDVGPVGHTMPPTTKRARRNRSRISFLPRIKAKVDSYLDISHDKALITMRQLYYVELAILSGQVNPIDPTENNIPCKHLCGELANDAEIIIVDMM